MTAGLVRRAEEAFKRGDLRETESLCQEILEGEPDNPQATLLMGLLAVRTGAHATGADWLMRALTLSPDDYIALLWLPIALRGASKPDEAIRFGERARSLWPKNPQVLESLALDYFNVKNYNKAEDCLKKAIAALPKNPSLHRKLGSLYETIGRDAEAAKEFQVVIDLSPRSEQGYIYLGRLLIGHGNFSQALSLCQSALDRGVVSAQIHLVFAQAWRGVRDTESADRHLKIAISLDPNIVLAAALWLNEDGKFKEAGELFQRSIEQRPVQGVAYFGLVKGRKITGEDQSLISQMEGLLTNPSLPVKEAAALRYALGKAADDMGLYEKAMNHYDFANRLRYQIYLEGKEFELAEIVAHRIATEKMFTTAFRNEHRDLASDTNIPIFVIGMIRSGTTLLEQIIASHPDVGGAGEQRFWVSELPSAVNLDAQRFDPKRFAEMRDRYLKVLRGLQPEAPRITDKMPMNYYCAGFLHLAYPKAPILHIKRNPVDTALSIYMTDLAKPPEFAHNRRNIVEAYREYEKMMDFWRSVIPGENLLEVNYEDLISDQEGSTRRIIDFCGLSWDPACLDFHRNDRQVSTPSMWQVRQPIYRTSVEKWRNYEPWLGEFRELLDCPPQ